MTRVLASLLGLCAVSGALAFDFAAQPPAVPEPGTLTLAIPVPGDDFAMPQHVYVLPVLLVPSDQSHLVEDPAEPGKDLSGNAMNAARLEEFRHGRQNLSVHLHMARRKYAAMLRNPVTGASRGTFRLASWNHATGHAGPVGATNHLIQPVIAQSPHGVSTIASAYARKNYRFLRPVLDAVGCKQSTCPFVFVVAVMGDPISPAGGQRFNHGYNNGGGWLVLNFLGDVVKAGAPGSQVTLQSTLLHELGHAFGLPHIADYCEIANALTCLLRLSEAGSSSIMSYNEKNFIFGCGFTSSTASNPGRWTGPCVYPGNAKVDAFPGALLPEDLRVLGMNRRVFPDLFYEEALDAPNTTVYGFSGTGNTAVEAHSTVELISPDTHPGFAIRPAVLIGADDNAFPEFHDAYDGVSMWHSREIGQDAWASLTIALPGKLRLTRVELYSGFERGTHVATGMRIRVDSVLVVETLGPTANQTLIFDRTGDSILVQVRAGSSGHVVLRGIRLWGEVAGQIAEIYPAAEPRATAASAGTFGGSLGNIVGSTQTVGAYAQSYQPVTGWHSSKVTPGAWVSVTVQFPEEVQLGYVKTHTGHSGYYHAARQVQVELRCVCGTTDVGGCKASTAACSSAGPGNSVFELVRRVNAAPDELVGFEAASARIWKIALRTATSAEQSVTPGYIYLRGLRFFRPNAKEIFPARLVAPGS